MDVAAKDGGSDLRFADLTPLPCVSHPNMLFAGSNYRQHVAEMMTHNKFNQHMRKPGESDKDFFQRNLAEVDRRAREGMPFFWTGLHSALCGANDPVPLPLIGEHPDWEMELGVIVGKTGRYVRPEDAGELIGGRSCRGSTRPSTRRTAWRSCCKPKSRRSKARSVSPACGWRAARQSPATLSWSASASRHRSAR